MPRAEQSAGNRLAVARLPPRPGVADFKSEWPTSNRKRRPTSPGICINASRQFLWGRQRRAADGLVSRASQPGVRSVCGASGGRSEAAWYDPVLARRLAPAQSSARLPALGRAFEGWFQVVLLPHLLPRPIKPRATYIQRIVFVGEPGGSRTRDLLIKSQLLCRLSYGLAARQHKGRKGGGQSPPRMIRRSAPRLQSGAPVTPDRSALQNVTTNYRSVRRRTRGSYIGTLYSCLSSGSRGTGPEPVTVSLDERFCPPARSGDSAAAALCTRADARCGARRRSGPELPAARGCQEAFVARRHRSARLGLYHSAQSACQRCPARGARGHQRLDRGYGLGPDDPTQRRRRAATARSRTGARRPARGAAPGDPARRSRGDAL